MNPEVNFKNLKVPAPQKPVNLFSVSLQMSRAINYSNQGSSERGIKTLDVPLKGDIFVEL